MANDLEEIAKLLEDALGAVRRVSEAVAEGKRGEMERHQRVTKLLSLAQGISSGHTQNIRSLESLLMALIEELAATKGVDPVRVAARHLSHIEEHPSLFETSTIAHQKSVAELLSQPGFPDAPRPRPSGGPRLIVDNDQSET